MRHIIHVLIRAVVGLPALMFFTAYTALMSLRYVLFCWNWITNGAPPPTDEFVDFSDVVAVRVIALGVIILERHDILEYTGIIPKNSERDVVTETSSAFGAYYLCFGLLFESLMMTFHVPNRLFSSTWFDTSVISMALCLSVLTFLASASLVRDYAKLAISARRNHSV